MFSTCFVYFVLFTVALLFLTFFTRICISIAPWDPTALREQLIDRRRPYVVASQIVAFGIGGERNLRLNLLLAKLRSGTHTLSIGPLHIPITRSFAIIMQPFYGCCDSGCFRRGRLLVNHGAAIWMARKRKQNLRHMFSDSDGVQQKNCIFISNVLCSMGTKIGMPAIRWAMLSRTEHPITWNHRRYCEHILVYIRVLLDDKK